MPKMGGRQRWFSRVEARLLLLRSGSLLVLIVLENRANVLARSEQLRRLVLLPAARDDYECPEVIVSLGSLARTVARYGRECPKVIAPFGSHPYRLHRSVSRLSACGRGLTAPVSVHVAYSCTRSTMQRERA